MIDLGLSRLYFANLPGFSIQVAGKKLLLKLAAFVYFREFQSYSNTVTIESSRLTGNH